MATVSATAPKVARIQWWSLQAEWVSYDKDDSFLSLGVRKRW